MDELDKRLVRELQGSLPQAENPYLELGLRLGISEDEVVERFVDESAENGMDVFRVFDALNDPRNMAHAMAAVKKTGKHAQGTICYTISPVHDTEGYVKLAGQLLDMGADSIALKDMAALLKPQPAYDIVKAIKDETGLQVNVHCHSTTGVTLVSLMKAIEGGADVVDTAISSMSLGPGHNPTESLQEMLEGTGYVADLDEALDFYAKNFDLRSVHEEVNEEQGVREAMLAVGDSGSCIQLLAPLRPDSPIGKFLDRNGPGIQQVAYRVDDIDAVCATLRERGVHDARIEVVHASEIIGMEESPVEAVRTKRDSSINVCARMASPRDPAPLDAWISAGRTGACVAESQMFMKRLPDDARSGVAS